NSLGGGTPFGAVGIKEPAPFSLEITRSVWEARRKTQLPRSPIPGREGPLVRLEGLPGLRRLERSDVCLLHPMREAVVRHSDGVASADPVSVGDAASRPSCGGLPVSAQSASPPRSR